MRIEFAQAGGIGYFPGLHRPVRPFLRRFRRNGTKLCIERGRKAQQLQNTLLEDVSQVLMCYSPRVSL